ncbi:hypothetical protein HN51_029436 [Arachis hypogaea]|uniref:Protein kinase domain-containing protein n=1 Tax=Arachis hypogaea TaxID=3818 RepID=A0A445BEP1_ARAHY|nr:Putative serine/threonine-protein kinase [Arachis hypogaea]RYR37148.1 hypothetical protein Ahy_A09g042078 [Arachis hypogaea]
MAPLFLLKTLILCELMFVVHVKAESEKCPTSFKCGKLGTIKFPFTDSKRPHCGVLAIHGCHDNNPNAQQVIVLNNKPNGRFVVLDIDFHTITITDLALRKSLKSQSQTQRCKAFSNNLSLPLMPSSPLGYSYAKFNKTLFTCPSNNLTLPPGFYNYNNCSNYHIYYDGFQQRLGDSPDFRWPGPLAACSKIHFALKDVLNDTDPFSFLFNEIVLEVELSSDCRNCFHHRRGHCQLDSQGNFLCVTDMSLAMKLGLGIGVSVIIIIGVLLIIWSRKARCGVGLSPNTEPESCSVFFGIPVFSYKDLELATKYFDRSRVLGDGGFGTVYYGKLKDGREVAIKRLYENNYRRVEQFMNEVKILTRLRHANLVSLYGCTSRHSHELLLVYEFISNGTVASHLHGGSARPAFLPWHIRMKVAIETATALAYLHASDIIHRDVKTNNILLDNSFCVKVADFGMSRLFPNDVTHVSTAPQGTPGYLDPEYHQFYQLTSKSDVYSFGVVLIELISSMPAIDMRRHKDEISLANLATNKISKGAIAELVDPSLGFESDSDVRRGVNLVAELAFQCLQRDRDLRPSMDAVLEALWKTESKKEEAEVSHGDAHSAAGHEEMKVLNQMNATPSSSPTAVTDKWDSESTTTPPSVTAQSRIQSKNRVLFYRSS